MKYRQKNNIILDSKILTWFFMQISIKLIKSLLSYCYRYHRDHGVPLKIDRFFFFNWPDIVDAEETRGEENCSFSIMEHLHAKVPVTLHKKKLCFLLTLFFFLGGGGRQIGETTLNLVKSARVRTIITLL